ncbi:MAG: hypothetical protein AAGI11_09885 [Pseudomonadota bacterium]
MSKGLLKGLGWALAIALYLRFGLEPTGWFFYELSFSTGVDGLYWGYSVFRGAGWAMSQWSLQNLFCLAAGALVGALVFWRTSRKETL